MPLLLGSQILKYFQNFAEETSSTNLFFFLYLPFIKSIKLQLSMDI